MKNLEKKFKDIEKDPETKGFGGGLTKDRLIREASETTKKYIEKKIEDLLLYEAIHGDKLSEEHKAELQQFKQHLEEKSNNLIAGARGYHEIERDLLGKPMKAPKVDYDAVSERVNDIVNSKVFEHQKDTGKSIQQIKRNYGIFLEDQRRKKQEDQELEEYKQKSHDELIEGKNTRSYFLNFTSKS